MRDLIDAMAEFAPPPRAQAASTAHRRTRDEPKMTGFVFKIQANMDPNHRDRIAFMRVCSGKLTRGMRAKLVRTGKSMALNAPQFFFAQDRSLAEEAFAGDVVGIPNHGMLRIGDTLTEGEDLVFRGVPSFAPEILRRVKLADAMKAKKLREALQQMAEEGVVQVFLPHDGAERHRRRGRRAAARRAGRAAPCGIRPAGFVRAEPLRGLPLGYVRRDAANSTSSSPPIRRRSPPTSTARRCSWRVRRSTCATSRSAGRKIAFSDIKDYQKSAA